MKMSQLKLVPIAAAMVLMGAAGSATAGAYALSSNNIQNFLVNGTGAGVTFGQSVDTSCATAQLTPPPGAPVSGSPCGPGVPDAGIAIATGSVFLPGSVSENSAFPLGLPNLPLGKNPPNNYSYADALIVHNANGTFSARNIAEAHLSTNATASGNAGNSSATEFDSQITITGSGIINFSFTADPLIVAFLNLGAQAGSFAQGVLHATLTITCTRTTGCGSGANAVAFGGTAFAWAPDGVVNAAGVTGVPGGVETADGENLNLTVSQFIGDGIGQTYSGAQTNSAFAASTGTLGAGTYQLSLAMEERDAVIKVIPEPGTIALLGLGLAGLGFASRRKPV